MKNLSLSLLVGAIFVGLFCGVLLAPGLAANASTENQPSAATGKAASKATPAKTAGAPSAADIAAAKASGKVWVNLSTGIYHRGGRWYGKTKNGKFMAADEAKKAGYKQAKRD